MKTRTQRPARQRRRGGGLWAMLVGTVLAVAVGAPVVSAVGETAGSAVGETAGRAVGAPGVLSNAREVARPSGMLLIAAAESKQAEQSTDALAAPKSAAATSGAAVVSKSARSSTNEVAAPKSTGATSGVAEASKTAGPAAGASADVASDQVLPLTSDQIAGHLGETVDWFHHLSSVEQLQIATADAATRDRLHQQALTAVELAFDFGKACAALLDAQARQQAASAAAAKAAAKGAATANGGAATKGAATANGTAAARGASTANGAATAKGASTAEDAAAKDAARVKEEAAGKDAASAKGAAASKGFAGRLDQAADDVQQHIDTLQAQVDSLKEQIAKAKGPERQTLIAQQGQVTAALGLASEVQRSVQDMEEFEANSITGDNGNLSPLDGQIADMERSVPELRVAEGARAAHAGAGSRSGANNGNGGSAGGSGGTGSGGSGPGAGSGNSSSTGSNGGTSSSSNGAGTTAVAANSAASASHPASSNTNAFRADSAGVIALITEWFTLHDMQRQLGDFVKETTDLQEELEKVRGALTGEVRALIGTGLAISSSTDPAELLAQRQALQAGAARFKQLATVLVPLGEQALVVENVGGMLDDWRTTLNTRMASVARFLLIRIGIVLGWIVVVLVVSDIWRRATFRYLHDVRRRRQFLVLRRVVTGVALTLVTVFGLVSEIGSIATYIGFVTAGIAVALQNVILAVVAYFFLIGRYGVRVGDRITLSGVTGRVVDIGLVRIYLMELSGPDLHATGRMVVLSNAVLFQPTALFKQIPGADYVWHTVTLTVAATADVLEAHKRLKAAAEEIYARYRPAIERQHAVVQRFIDFDASSPQPEVRVRLTENGLECSVRYPVELENAALTDQQMLKALRDALEHDSQFKLVAAGAVVLKSSDN